MKLRTASIMTMSLALALTACKQETEQAAPAAAQSAASPTTGAAPTQAPDDLKTGPHDKVLRIESSNPEVAVTGVFLDGRPLKSVGLGTAKVRVVLEADPDEGNGTPCTSEGFEVRLANAIIARPLMNFCATDYLMTVSAAKPALPKSLPTLPDGFSWEIDGRGNDKMIYLGIPETDATAMLATCRTGETRAQVKFFQDVGQTPTLDVYGRDRVLRYMLNRTSDGSSEDAPTNEIDLSIDDQLFKLLTSGQRLTYRIDKGDFLSLDPEPGVETIREFVAWCAGD